VRDFELDLFFYLGGHLGGPTGSSERYDLESTADVESKARSRHSTMVQSQVAGRGD